jgi:hypothetical protein
MGSLKEDIKTASDWIVKAFEEDGFKLDKSIHSLLEVDRFFNENMEHGKPKRDGRLDGTGFGSILFAIGAYIGETIIQNTKGTQWITNDNDIDGEINISLKLSNGTIIWPVQKVMKRFQNGDQDAIYPYVKIITTGE